VNTLDRINPESNELL